MWQSIVRDLQSVIHQREKTLSNSLLVTAEAISAAACAGCSAQLIPRRAPFPVGQENCYTATENPLRALKRLI